MQVTHDTPDGSPPTRDLSQRDELNSAKRKAERNCSNLSALKSMAIGSCRVTSGSSLKQHGQSYLNSAER